MRARAELFFLLLSWSVGCNDPAAKHKATGNLRFKAGQYAEARREYEAALRADPEDPNAHILVGHARFELEDYTGARAAYEEALRLDPRAPEAHRALAAVIARTAAPGDRAAFATFTAHLEKVVDFDADGQLDNPRDRSGIVLAAQALSETADPADAELYRKAQDRAEVLLREHALKLDDRDPKTLFQLALVYARKRDLPTALRVIARLEAVAGDKGYGPYARAIAHTVVGDHEEALASVEQLLQDDSFDPETLRRDRLLRPLASSARFDELVRAARARRKTE